MTQATSAPEDGIAEAIEDLTDQTRALVRTEVTAAQHEMWDKAKQFLPAAGTAGAAAVLGLLSLASAYRFSVRVMEKLFPPSAAALLACLAYGAGAGAAASAAARQFRALPAPWPTETVADAGSRLGSVKGA